MDEEPEPTSEGSLIEAYLTREEMASPILVNGPTNANPLWKLKPIPKSTHDLNIQPKLDDNPVSSSLDLTSDILFISPSNQAIDWPSIGDSFPMTTLNPQPVKIKSPIKGRKSPETPMAAPKQAKKKEIEGQTTLTLKPLTIKS